MLTTALYLRISVDDEKLGESDSISNQRDLLNAYVLSNAELSKGEVLTFVDDGWSGTNFERPQVKQLLNLVHSGAVQCIVVKDLSRWGRNYYEVSQYLDQMFPALGIRFISLGEGYDSNNYKDRTAPLDVAFGTIMHDVYSKELSLKVRQSYIAKTKKAEFLSGSPPFGFVKSDTNNNRLEIDRDAADIVCRIFKMACEGNSNTQIALALNSDGIDTPLMYRKRKGYSLRGAHFAIGNKMFWTSESVRRIIIDERYTGVMIGGKQRIAKPGSHKVERLPKNDWIRVPNSHKAIVTEEVFKQANAHIRRSKSNLNVTKNRIFDCRVKCGCCGRSMGYSATKEPYYYCRSLKFNNMDCFDGRIYLDSLKEVVVTTIRAEICKVLELKRGKATNSLKKNDKKLFVDEYKRIKIHLNLLRQKEISLYEDFIDGKISKERYILSTTADNEESRRLQARVDELNSMIELSAYKEKNFKETTIQQIEPVINENIFSEEILKLVDHVIIFDNKRVELEFAFRDTNSHQLISADTMHEKAH